MACDSFVVVVLLFIHFSAVRLEQNGVKQKKNNAVKYYVKGEHHNATEISRKTAT